MTSLQVTKFLCGAWGLDAVSWRHRWRQTAVKFLKDGFHGSEVNAWSGGWQSETRPKNDLKLTENPEEMGTGASTASTQQWTAADEDNSTIVLQDVRPLTAANENLPPSNDMTGLTKLVEAKNKFMKSREKNTACFQKQVSDFYLQLRELMIVQANTLTWSLIA